MLTTQERSLLIDQIRRLPDQINYLVAALSPDELGGRFVPGEWSAAQNIHHLADSHMTSYVRCRLIATEEEPPLKPYDPDRWAALPDAEDVDVAASQQILHGMHERWVKFWQSLPAEAWPRQGFHPEHGLVTLEDQLKLYARHGQGHVDQIRRTVAAQYSELPATHAELLARTDREWERLNSLIARMTPAQLESKTEGGWSPKLHLAHISAWERLLARHILGDEPEHVAFDLTAEQVETSELDQLNDLLMQADASKPLDVVLAAFHATHEEVRAAVTGMEWAAWHGQTREWNGQQQPRLGWLANNCYEHYLEHWQWLPVV